MTIGTIVLNKSNGLATIKIQEPPKKKQNVIEVRLFLDGAEYDFKYTAPISQTLIHSQKNSATLCEIIRRSLAIEFGKVEKI